MSKRKKEELTEEDKDKVIDLILDDNSDEDTMVSINRFLWDPEGPKP